MNPSAPASPRVTSNHPSPLASRLAATDRLLQNLLGGDRPTHPVPPHLQEPYDALYRELNHSLGQGRNGSAFLLGPPASGKRTVLEAVLRRLAADAPSLVRRVVLDGRVLPGHATGRVVHEMLRQLTDAALRTEPSLPQPNDASTPHKRRRTTRTQLLRLRQRANFLSDMDLLDQILKVAAMDQVPILMVLHHLETFTAPVARASTGKARRGNSSHHQNHSNHNSNPHLLLYHLLDRIGQADSGLVLVGTSRHAGLLGLLEKRVQSRVHGSTKCIHFSAHGATADWAKSSAQVMLLDRLVHVHRPTADDTHDNDASPLCQDEEAMELGKEIATILIEDPSKERSDDHHDDADARQVRAMLQRSLALGRDMRWFLRVATLALCVYREDCRRALAPTRDPQGTNNLPPCRHTARYWLHALLDMGATPMTKAGPLDPLRSARMQVLTDLTGPQVAMVLSARRILARDAQKTEETYNALTFERILQEYRRYRGASDRYTLGVLRRAFQDLLQLSVLRPAIDHTGSGPFQYQHGPIAFHDAHTLARVPLHCTYDVNAEVKQALDRGLFTVASTALTEWAKKVT